MPDITPLDVGFATAEATYSAAAAGGDTFTNTYPTIVLLKNGSGGAIVVTADSLKLSNYDDDANESISIPAGEERFFGPFKAARFNSTAGKVALSYDGVTSLTLAVLRVTSTRG